MALIVTIGEMTVQCETAAQVVELYRLLGGEAKSASTSKGSGESAAVSVGSRWTEHRIREFFRVIKPTQRRLVEALLQANDPQLDAQLCGLLGLKDGRALAGVFTALFKNAKKVGADPKEIYRRKRVPVGDKQQFEYTLAETFRSAAQRWKP